MNPEDQDRTEERTPAEPEERPDGGQEASQADSGTELEERRKAFSRRAILQAGWALPVIASVSIPADAFSLSPILTHEDLGEMPHDDTPPVHTDVGGHSDTAVHADTPAV